ncbi:MAG: isopentenyl phosphate kinase [Nanoarchaeota archaeon]
MQEVIIIKLGGSLITNKNKPFTYNSQIVEKIIKEIKDSIPKIKEKIILTNGAGSFGHPLAKKYKIIDGYKNKESIRGFCLTQNAVSKLNKFILKELLKNKINALTIHPSSIVTFNGNKFEMFDKTLINSIENNIIPLLYGDVIFDLNKKFSIISTEQIINLISKDLKKKYKIKKIILAGITNGVYDKNEKLIPTINNQNIKEILNNNLKSDGIDVTGGMFHKIKEMQNLAGKDIKIQIINGLIKGNLKKSITSNLNIGTTIEK